MSPRAAWRLERLGWEVYDYAAGKADWIAAGLPTEGRLSHPPRVIDALDADPQTCSLFEPVSAAWDRMDRAGAEVCVVVNEAGVVQGRLRHREAEAGDPRPAETVMEPGPTTIRADADLDQTTERMRRRRVSSLIVTDPDGVLLGLIRTQTS
jgi:CBS domain-containing protein